MAVVGKWGNSAAVRIPATVLATAGFALEEPVEVRGEKGRIVIEAAARKRFRIGDLVSGINADNLHDAIDTGPPVGGEAW